MKVRVTDYFASKKIKGKMIPPGVHDINPDWARELISEGIAEPVDGPSDAERAIDNLRYEPQFESREEKPIKKKKRKIQQIKFNKQKNKIV